MKKKVSLLLNLLIVILEIIGFIISTNVNKRIAIEYYTEDSNILALASSLLFVIFLLSKNKIPRWLQLFKYMTTICLTVTFLVVLFILGPMLEFNYGWLFLSNGLLFQHLLCPILSIIVFIYFDDICFKKRDSIRGLYLTIIYATIIIILNILKIIKGPYPFLYIYEQPIYMSIIWAILIPGFAFIISVVLKNLYVKIRKIPN